MMFLELLVAREGRGSPCAEAVASTLASTLCMTPRGVALL